jgi:putative MATE family efflux protein
MRFSNKGLIKIILPLMAQQALSVMVGLVDSIMVSSAGEAAVSGVSLINTLDILLIYAFSALASGGAVVVAQFIGKGDNDLARDSAKQLIYSATLVATVLTVLVLVFRFPLLNALYGDVEADVMGHAQRYFFFAALSFPFLALYDAVAALYRAMGKTSLTMNVSILMNVLNVIGNAILIYHFNMGAAGAAIATLISRAVGSSLIVLLIHNKKNIIYVERIFHFRPNFAIIKSILRIGVPNGIENIMFQFGKLLTQSLISSLGTVTIAANAVAHTLATFQYMPGGAIGTAAITIVGQCVGAGEKEQAKKYSKILLLFSYISLLAIVILTFVFAKPVISIYGLTDESSRLALKLILYHGICATIIWPVAFMLPQVFRAASDVKFTLVVSMISMWIFRVALSYPLTLDYGLGLGAMGVWIAMTIDWLFRFIVFAIHFVRGRWLTKYKPTLKI